MSTNGNKSLKRRNVKTDIKAEPAPKVKKNGESLTKKDLGKMYDDLQIKHEIVVEQCNTYLRRISELENTIKYLNEKGAKTTRIETLVDNVAQTDVLACTKCDFPAFCLEDLCDHMYQEHPIKCKFCERSSETENMQPIHIDSRFTCHYCEEVFLSKSDVMIHTKNNHCDKVKHCENFLNGCCSFQENCWFLHDEAFKDSGAKIKCNFCDFKCYTINNLMCHKKYQHMETVKMCENEDKICSFGPERCWFIHKEHIEKAYEKERKK